MMKKLGEGGMGQVWLAEQMAPIRRQVALKLVKVGHVRRLGTATIPLRTPVVGHHGAPIDCQVFDAGATQDGQPYFVMEYVPGLHITDYCDQKTPSIMDSIQVPSRVLEMTLISNRSTAIRALRR